MENRNNTMLTVIAVATLLVAIVGASFAYFTATAQTTTKSVQTGKLTVSTTTGTVNESNIKPVDAATLNESWDDIKANADIVKIPVTVNTDGTTITTKNADKIIAKLDLYLTAVSGAYNTDSWADKTYTKGAIEDIKWKLVNTEDGSAINNGSFNNDTSITEITLTPAETTLNITYDKTQYDYTLLVYIENDADNSQDDLQGLTLSAKVRADVKQFETANN